MRIEMCRNGYFLKFYRLGRASNLPEKLEMKEFLKRNNLCILLPIESYVMSVCVNPILRWIIESCQNSEV